MRNRRSKITYANAVWRRRTRGSASSST